MSGVSTEATARWYVENGADVQKIVIGMVFYVLVPGRSILMLFRCAALWTWVRKHRRHVQAFQRRWSWFVFTLVCRYVVNFNYVTGTWDAGQYDYKALPFPNATVHDDLEAIASYSYDPAKRQLITYDTPAIATLKAIWTITQGYRGS